MVPSLTPVLCAGGEQGSRPSEPVYRDGSRLSFMRCSFDRSSAIMFRQSDVMCRGAPALRFVASSKLPTLTRFIRRTKLADFVHCYLHFYRPPVSPTYFLPRNQPQDLSTTFSVSWSNRKFLRLKYTLQLHSSRADSVNELATFATFQHQSLNFLVLICLNFGLRSEMLSR